MGVGLAIIAGQYCGRYISCDKVFPDSWGPGNPTVVPLCATVPFPIVQPSHITDPLSMAEISYFSQVMLRVATGQKCHSISIFSILVYFSTGIFFLYKMNKMQLLGLIILLSSIICIIMMPEVIDIKAVGLFTAGRCWILGGKQGLMLNGLLKYYSQKQPARLGTVKLVKW